MQKTRSQAFDGQSEKGQNMKGSSELSAAVVLQLLNVTDVTD